MSYRAELLTPDFSSVRVLIGHNGDVHWEPGGVFTTTCDINVRYFPFDDQLCMIEFGAWAYYSARVNITSASDIVSVRSTCFRTINFCSWYKPAVFTARSSYASAVLGIVILSVRLSNACFVTKL